LHSTIQTQLTLIYSKSYKRRNKIYLACILLSILFFSSVSAQGVHYGGIQQIQVDFGPTAAKTNLSIINGIRFNRFFVGMGADARFRSVYPYFRYYEHPNGKTFSLFVDGRYYINKNKTFFVKLDAGINLLYGVSQVEDYYEIDRNGGLYSACGLGFKVRLAKEVFYIFDIGYCSRQTRYDYSYRSAHDSQWYTQKFDQRRNFITVSMGIELF